MSARPAMPRTAFADAFLRALLIWAARQTRGGPIALPTGRVDGDELRRVVIALVCSRGERERAA